MNRTSRLSVVTGVLGTLLLSTGIAFAQSQPAPTADARADRAAKHQEKREKMKARFEEAFKKADVNGDGALTREEADKGMPRLAKHFDAIDANKDGKVTREEIRTHMEAKMKQRHEKHRMDRGAGKGPGDQPAK